MRDDFSADTIRKLGERVNLHCSNPTCRAPTKARHTESEKSTSVGKACHIHAASPGGPRYQPSQTEEQRESIENGVWLCETCGTKVDKDSERFPADVLRAWKTLAEHEANERLGVPRPPQANPMDAVFAAKKSDDTPQCSLPRQSTGRAF
jgi:hypothetical protein